MAHTKVEERSLLSDFAKKWRIELLAFIYLGNELIHIDACEVQLVLPS
jgi:hypothetical protein